MNGPGNSSKRSIMDESPSIPRRFISVDVDNLMEDSLLQMSMSSLTSQSRASRERRSRLSRDQSPMRPRRTLDKVVSPGVKPDEDDDFLKLSRVLLL